MLLGGGAPLLGMNYQFLGHRYVQILMYFVNNIIGRSSKIYRHQISKFVEVVRERHENYRH